MTDDHSRRRAQGVRGRGRHGKVAHRVDRRDTSGSCGRNQRAWRQRDDRTEPADVNVTVQSLVISAIAPDASERDRSLLGLELDHDVSRARLTQSLIDAGLPPSSLILRREQAVHALVEVDGHIMDDDPRLAALRHPVVLGAYAIPEDGGAA